jgi:hypothetical protein
LNRISGAEINSIATVSITTYSIMTLSTTINKMRHYYAECRMQALSAVFFMLDVILIII